MSYAVSTSTVAFYRGQDDSGSVHVAVQQKPAGFADEDSHLRAESLRGSCKASTTEARSFKGAPSVNAGTARTRVY